MTQTPEPTDDSDPRGFWSAPISIDALKAAMYDVGAGAAPDDLDAQRVADITEECAQEARRFVRDARAGLRQEVAGLLREVAAGRLEYAAGYSHNEKNPVLVAQKRSLETEAATLEAAAKIAEGDTGPLYGLLPSWRWSEEMTAALYAKPEDGRG